MAAEIIIAASLTRAASTPRARAASSLAHGEQPGAEAALLDQPHDHERQADERQDDPEEWRAVLELERLCSQVERDQDAYACARDRRDARNNAQHFGKRQRDQREIRALQS